MRRAIPMLILAVSAAFASCTVFPPQLRVSGVLLVGESERQTGLVTISARPGWDNPGKGHKKITGFYVEFRNTGSRPVSIIWKKSAVIYGGMVYTPFLEGQRYEDYLSPMEALVIPPNSVVRKYVYSSQQVFREAGKSGNWKLKPLEADQVILEFYVQSGTIFDRYRIEVK